VNSGIWEVDDWLDQIKVRDLLDGALCILAQGDFWNCLVERVSFLEIPFEPEPTGCCISTELG